MSDETLPAFSSLNVGDQVAAREVEITRDTLVRYAAASGDFNPIHYNDAFAQQVGLPGVIAHGMLTMGIGASVIEEWAGAGNIADFQARFTRPVPVPALESAHVSVTAVVGALDHELQQARIDVTVTFEGAKVLGKAQAIVDCA
ncbi:MaoC family dehydratase N-terminal domain-containing protein [Demequina sp. TTPB684]|uniref:MaoC/PaaZ C-terminal domain-containing protein n=1 Tax=unclassified Demequina TaxID=2620311 RepID=UPI001CF58833|nr:MULTISPECIES: MaoC/PaaZ C-terminal domain-containing protein [unclassified Demequina]MCB2412963.1 MaoC family dehydratase N-terminal domain-containing protein [Demequina sp. TTPB684]UPU88349.1 MaoC family dehydratase N-terminal domain-containing protein [Demequina sp. TMPB413]